MEKVMEEVKKTENIIKGLDIILENLDISHKDYLRYKSKKDSYEQLLITFKKILKTKKR